MAEESHREVSAETVPPKDENPEFGEPKTDGVAAAPDTTPNNEAPQQTQPATLHIDRKEFTTAYRGIMDKVSAIYGYDKMLSGYSPEEWKKRVDEDVTFLPVQQATMQIMLQTLLLAMQQLGDALCLDVDLTVIPGELSNTTNAELRRVLGKHSGSRPRLNVYDDMFSAMDRLTELHQDTANLPTLSGIANLLDENQNYSPDPEAMEPFLSTDATTSATTPKKPKGAAPPQPFSPMMTGNVTKDWSRMMDKRPAIQFMVYNNKQQSKAKRGSATVRDGHIVPTTAIMENKQGFVEENRVWRCNSFHAAGFGAGFHAYMLKRDKSCFLCNTSREKKGKKGITFNGKLMDYAIPEVEVPRYRYVIQIDEKCEVDDRGAVVMIDPRGYHRRPHNINHGDILRVGINDIPSDRFIGTTFQDEWKRQSLTTPPPLGIADMQTTVNRFNNGQTGVLVSKKEPGKNPSRRMQTATSVKSRKIAAPAKSRKRSLPGASLDDAASDISDKSETKNRKNHGKSKKQRKHAGKNVPTPSAALATKGPTTDNCKSNIAADTGKPQPWTNVGLPVHPSLAMIMNTPSLTRGFSDPYKPHHNFGLPTGNDELDLLDAPTPGGSV